MAGQHDSREDEMTATELVCGYQIQVDRSGVGHAWADIDADDIPANVRQEIEAEIIDGGQESCDSYRASNGLSYRW